jgi:hypothetical protein
MFFKSVRHFLGFLLLLVPIFIMVLLLRPIPGGISVPVLTILQWTGLGSMILWVILTSTSGWCLVKSGFSVRGQSLCAVISYAIGAALLFGRLPELNPSLYNEPVILQIFAYHVVYGGVVCSLFDIFMPD